jgi:hypothetical protein
MSHLSIPPDLNPYKIFLKLRDVVGLNQPMEFEEYDDYSDEEDSEDYYNFNQSEHP